MAMSGAEMDDKRLQGMSLCSDAEREYRAHPDVEIDKAMTGHSATGTDKGAR